MMPRYVTVDHLDDTGVRIHPTDVVHPFARQVNMPFVIDGYAAGAVEFRFHCRPPIATATQFAGAGHSGEDAGLVVDLADQIAAVAQLREVQVAVPVLGKIVRFVQLRLDRRDAVAVASRDAVSPRTGAESRPGRCARCAVPSSR